MLTWKRSGTTRVSDHRVFFIDKEVVSCVERERTIEIARIETPDWCTVVPIDADGRLILVRQFRFGAWQPTLETPGGLVDANENPIEAAHRELAEETGYLSTDMRPLGWVFANPALQPTRLHMFAALQCTPTGHQHFDADEECDVVMVPMSEARELLFGGKLEHALTQVALMRYLMFHSLV